MHTRVQERTALAASCITIVLVLVQALCYRRVNNNDKGCFGCMLQVGQFALRTSEYKYTKLSSILQGAQHIFL